MFRLPKNRTSRAIILSFIKRRPTTGYTRKELTRATGIPIQTVCPRVFELLADRKIKTSKTARRGSSAVLYAR